MIRLAAPMIPSAASSVSLAAAFALPSDPTTGRSENLTRVRPAQRARPFHQKHVRVHSATHGERLRVPGGPEAGRDPVAGWDRLFLPTFPPAAPPFSSTGSFALVVIFRMSGRRLGRLCWLRSRLSRVYHQCRHTASQDSEESGTLSDDVLGSSS